MGTCVVSDAFISLQKRSKGLHFTAFWILQVLLVTVNALFGSHSDVVELTPSNFDSKVIDSDDVWIVEFYAPWCGHCQAFVSEYSKAASALKGIVKVGAVNSDQHKSLGSQYGIRGFPTVKIFGSNKKKPQDFSGARTAQGLVDAAFKELRNAVDSRLGGKKTKGSSSDGGRKESDTKDVIELTDSNFKTTVLDSEDMWLVEFYAPWCGHCKNLAPHWEKAASELKGKVKLGALDATVHTLMAQKYQIKGFPTIKYFAPGQKDSDSADDYNGGRTAEDIVNWANDKVSESAPPPEVNEITDEDTLKDACESHQLCIISFLPHILDCQSSCRNEYIDTLLKVGNKYKKNRWGWIWAEATAQPQLEEVLGIGGFGYPAMAAVNVRKMKFSLLRGSFSNDGISEFIREVSVGRGSSAPIKGAKLPEIVKSEPWDGKDGELPVEEDIDLSDIDLDDTHAEL